MLNVLGEGSFGVVYMAIADGILEDGKKHNVAVKMLKGRAQYTLKTQYSTLVIL